jgi:GTP cyclohydrolase II
MAGVSAAAAAKAARTVSIERTPFPRLSSVCVGYQKGGAGPTPPAEVNRRRTSLWSRPGTPYIREARSGVASGLGTFLAALRQLRFCCIPNLFTSLSETSMTARPVKSVKLDIDWSAQTILPISFQGDVLRLEARAYQGANPEAQALALINRGTGDDAQALATVRVHSGCVTGDIFHSLRCDCHAQLQKALAHITKVPNGVLLYLPFQEGRGIGLVNKIRAYALQDQGFDTVDANIEIGAPIDARDYALAAHILKDLGFNEIKLLTNNPAKVEALRAEGITVAEQLPLVVEPSIYNKRYLDTKRRRMAHKI